MCGGWSWGKGKEGQRSKLGGQASSYVFSAGCLEGREWLVRTSLMLARGEFAPSYSVVRTSVSLVPTAQKHTWVSTSPELVKSGSSSLSDSQVAQSLDRYPKEGVSASSSLPSGCSALHQGCYLDGVAEKRLRARHR